MTKIFSLRRCVETTWGVSIGVARPLGPGIAFKDFQSPTWIKMENHYPRRDLVLRLFELVECNGSGR